MFNVPKMRGVFSLRYEGGSPLHIKVQIEVSVQKDNSIFGWNFFHGAGEGHNPLLLNNSSDH